MEIKLDSKLMKAVNGLMLFAIAIILMGASLAKLNANYAGWLGEKDPAYIGWLPGLFLIFGACALCYGWFVDGKKDCVLATRACVYSLLAIAIFANKTVIGTSMFVLLWAMMEGILMAFEGWKAKEAKANLWEVTAFLGAVIVLLAFIAMMVINEKYYGKKFENAEDPKTVKMVFEGVIFLFVALGNIFPACADYLPKVNLQLKK